ncbi:unnamed protein product [Linum tenue]|uniref:Uncharacterized protein n=1 Tax=Linum tenue TaxID=586396 RepID=A0AAV0LDG5_9ROSI|nr:unnamed protein product [Linum tenue]
MSPCRPGFSAILFPSMEIWVSSRKPTAEVSLTDLGAIAKKEGEAEPSPSRRSHCDCRRRTQKEEEGLVEEDRAEDEGKKEEGEGWGIFCS